jgi:3-oxoacyl-[acyl-carrier protein] reductase
MNLPASSRAIDLGFTPGETVVVTGAGSGIGRALALHALELGLRVSAWDLNAAGLEGLAAEAGPQADLHTLVADIGKAEDIAAGFAAVTDRYGTPAYLANNAGPASAIPLPFEEALRICVGGVRAMTETWAGLGLPGHAAMVLTASVAGNRIGTESDWYSASKAALMGYVRHLAAHRASEFRSNGVAPGMTDTPRLAGFAESETGQRVLQRIPLGRMATPDDIAWSILFLLSPLASYVNGVMLTVDGGWTITQ